MSNQIVDFTKIRRQLGTIEVPPSFESDVKGWIEAQAEQYGLRWFLAHALDGIIWGEVRDNELCISPLFSADLRASTLRVARLFGEPGELQIWWNYGEWKARIVEDGKIAGDDIDCFDERYYLWGTDIESAENGFLLLKHGKEGLRHAPPMEAGATPPLWLTIRHYIATDEDNQAYIECSRLVTLNSNTTGEAR